MKRRALLDVNLLVALFDPDHVHHDLAHDWFADNRSDGWATCPLTEGGVIRVLTNPRYGSPVSDMGAVVSRVKRLQASRDHEFWADAVSLTDAARFNVSHVRGHRQIIDVYLLGLAQSRGGRLATFDRSIPLGAVVGADAGSIAVIQAPDHG